MNFGDIRMRLKKKKKTTHGRFNSLPNAINTDSKASFHGLRRSVN